MGKYIIKHLGYEISKYTCEYDSYGVREELLYPIKMNRSTLGQPQPDTNLATYLIQFKEFEKTNVKIEKKGNEVRLFKSFFFLC